MGNVEVGYSSLDHTFKLLHFSDIMHLICTLFAPQILHNLCFSFLLGITAVPREIENKGYAKFWGTNKMHYGKCGSGV